LIEIEIMIGIQIEIVIGIQVEAVVHFEEEVQEAEDQDLIVE